MSEGTSSPVGLIPGDPAVLRAQSADLHRRSDLANEAGDGLRDIDLGAWTGRSAQEFRGRFEGEPARWFNAADALASAAEALDGYAQVLAWAQVQAGEAVREWDRGQALTVAAVRVYEAARAAGTVAGPFVDPGLGLRQAAQSRLESARRQVRAEAGAAASVLVEQAGYAPERLRWWDRAVACLADAGASAVNTLASVGNAMLHHPDNVAEIVGGALLAGAGAGGEAGGVLLDITGVGAVIGVPVNVVSAAGIAAGVGLAGVGAAGLIGHATTDDHLTPMRSDRTGSGKNDRHGDGGRTTNRNQAEIERLEDQLKELNRAQGSRREKDALRSKIRNLRQAGERAAKGEEHSRGAKR